MFNRALPVLAVMMRYAEQFGHQRRGSSSCRKTSCFPSTPKARFLRAEEPKMTDDMMTLRSMMEKSADADFLREMIGFSAQRLMELEVGGLTGAARG